MKRIDAIFYTAKRAAKRAGDSRPGASLIEALVVLALFILICLALTSLYLQHGWSLHLGKAQFDSVEGARGALNGISAYAVQARRVVSSTSISGTLYATGTSTLVLEIPTVNASGGIVEGASDYAVFYTSAGTLYRNVAPSAESARVAGVRFLAGNLTDLAFSYDSAYFAQVKKITVAVTSTAGTADAHETQREFGEFRLRNY